MFNYLKVQARTRLYGLAEARSLARYAAKRRSDEMILVYSPGQAGSSALDLSLRKHNAFSAKVHHLHFLNPVTIAGDVDYARWFYANRGRVYAHFLRSLHVRKRLDAGFDLDKLRVIVNFRDPIRSCIAGFFQNLYRLPGFDPTRLDHEDSAAFAAELTSMFLRRGDIRHYLNWFDLQIKDVFGINVYDYAFPHDRGYQIIDDEKPALLIMRTERLSEVATPAINEFLGLPDFTIERANKAADKNYHRHYQKFLEQIEIPGNWLGSVERSDFFRHFFSADEQAEILRPWQDRIRSDD